MKTQVRDSDQTTSFPALAVVRFVSQSSYLNVVMLTVSLVIMRAASDRCFCFW